MKKCRFPDCPATKLQRFGLCNKHRKWVEKGYYSEDLRLLKPMTRTSTPTVCKIKDCKNPHASLGFCVKHYRRFKDGILDANGDQLREFKRPIKYPKDMECFLCGKKGKIVKGFCRFHYPQYLKGIIDYDGVTLRKLKRVQRYESWQTCKAKGCRKKPRAKGWCNSHKASFDRGLYNLKGERLAPSFAKNKDRPCSTPQCGQPAHCKGLCRLHYNRQRTGYLGPAGFKNVGHPCSETGCSKEAYCRTLCVQHYFKWKRKNSPKTKANPSGQISSGTLENSIASDLEQKESGFESATRSEALGHST